MTDSTDGAWKLPAKTSALWSNKEAELERKIMGGKEKDGETKPGCKGGKKEEYGCLFKEGRCVHKLSKKYALAVA